MTPSLWEPECYDLNENDLDRFMNLNMWSLVGGTGWEGYGSLRKWSFAGGSESLRVGLEVL